MSIQLPEGGRRIVFAVNNSPESLNAVRYGLEAIVKDGDIVVIVYVKTTPELEGRGSGAKHLFGDDGAPLIPLDYSILSENQDLLRYGLKVDPRLTDMLDKAEKARNLLVFFKVYFGDPRTKVVDVTERLRAAHMIIGCRAQSALKRMLWGSVSTAAAQNAQCPVTIVKLAKSQTLPAEEEIAEESTTTPEDS